MRLWAIDAMKQHNQGDIVMIGTLLLAKIFAAHLAHGAVAAHATHAAVAAHAVGASHATHAVGAAHATYAAGVAGVAHVAEAAVAAPIILSALGTPIFTATVGNLASDSIKHLVKNTSNTAEQAFENEEEAERIFPEAVAEASKAFLDYNKTQSEEAFDRYVEASALAQLAYNFINRNNWS